MSFQGFFSEALSASEECFIAALYLLGKKPVGNFIDEELARTCCLILDKLSELPEECARELAISILESEGGSC